MKRQVDAIQWGGGGSNIMFPWSPKADAIQWGGVVPWSPKADAIQCEGGG